MTDGSLPFYIEKVLSQFSNRGQGRVNQKGEEIKFLPFGWGGP